MINLWLIFVLSFVTSGRCREDNAELVIASVRLETCSGCKLYDLPDLKTFIFDDFLKYDKTELKLVQGSSPCFKFLDKDGKVVESMYINKLSRKQCNTILIDRGFKHKVDNAKEL